MSEREYSKSRTNVGKDGNVGVARDLEVWVGDIAGENPVGGTVEVELVLSSVFPSRLGVVSSRGCDKCHLRVCTKLELSIHRENNLLELDLCRAVWCGSGDGNNSAKLALLWCACASLLVELGKAHREPDGGSSDRKRPVLPVLLVKPE